jgi:hypothetical protein
MVHYLDDPENGVDIVFLPARGAQIALFFSTLASLLAIAFLVRVRRLPTPLSSSWLR